MRILLIEDESGLRESIEHYLDKEGYIVESAADFLSASSKVRNFDYDCVLVDIMIPHGSGLDIVKQLKQIESKARIIILSAKISLNDKITGLEYGADDYLSKPFHLSELNARIKALMRRRKVDETKEAELGKDIIVNEITISPDQRKVTVNEQTISLTKKEYDLLLYFVSNQNRMVTRSSVIEHLWGYNKDLVVNDDILYSHLKNLRRKLAEKGCKDYIKAVYGIGYIWQTNE